MSVGNPDGNPLEGPESEPEPAGPLALLCEAIERAHRLGWRTITVKRMARLYNGDASALPPDPATAPRSAFGQSQWGFDRMRAEQPHRF